MQKPVSVSDCCDGSSMLESASDPPVLSTESPAAPPHWARYLVPYPTEETSSSPTQSSLFTQLDTHTCIVENRARTRPPTSFSGTLPPNCDDYELALAIKPQVTKHFVKDRRAWLRKERALLESDRRAGARVTGASIARALKPTCTRPDKPRHTALRISAPTRQDKDFTPLADRTNNLKVEWTGEPVDLTNDSYVGPTSS
ncbi:hypothetical protein BGZ61DRAFT_485211 [Ilyonectria robusta]|uniref:uncharacterized protein n=1 Tax=Ilyonectria robusta TaxID=1079257 RepID=UPI001E8DDDB9|nr:uncharacterized protein BGZ61DRAFT_485211 [Ilyonectria robusta]KAH8662757.1 hypothetical protein BGZ61DRAFT_485211 [Ilyonectria robusta]